MLKFSTEAQTAVIGRVQIDDDGDLRVYLNNVFVGYYDASLKGEFFKMPLGEHEIKTLEKSGFVLSEGSNSKPGATMKVHA